MPIFPLLPSNFLLPTFPPAVAAFSVVDDLVSLKKESLRAFLREGDVRWGFDVENATAKVADKMGMVPGDGPFKALRLPRIGHADDAADIRQFLHGSVDRCDTQSRKSIESSRVQFRNGERSGRISEDGLDCFQLFGGPMTHEWFSIKLPTSSGKARMALKSQDRSCFIVDN